MTDSRMISPESKEFLYLQLSNLLRQDIITGVLKPGHQLPSYQELIQKYKLSLSTVKLAINELVNQGLIYKRQGKGTFVSTRIPGKIKTGLVGLIITDIRNPFYSHLAHVVDHSARDFNYGVIHMYTEDLPELESNAIDRLIEKNVEGIIAAPSTGPKSEEIYQKLVLNNIPLVFLDRYLPEIPADYVLVDNDKGVRLALEYLYSIGHSDIACISAAPMNIFAEKRINDFKQILIEHELPIVEDWIYISPKKTDDGGYEAVKKIFSSNRRPSAIFAINDIIAIGAIRALHEMGIKIPKDVSIIGFDNIPLSGYTRPPLTSITQPVNRMGTYAMELLMKRIEKKPDNLNDYQHILLEPKLIIRKSCMKREI